MRIAALCLLLIGLAAPAHAQWRCLSGNCRDGTGRADYASTDGLDRNYVGTFQDSRPSGWGTLSFSNGQTYEGDFRNGNREGRGVYTWPNGERHEGAYRNDQRNGYGVYTWADGRHYEGQYRDNNTHGRGSLTMPDGNRYEGEFVEGNREGLFTLTYPGGRAERVTFRGDVQQSASTLSVGGAAVSGSLTSGSRSYDVPGLGNRPAIDYSLYIASGQTVTVRMEGDFDTYLRVLDENGAVAYNDDDGTTRASAVTFTTDHAGTYTVRATTYSAAARGSFTLRATPSYAPPPPAPGNVRQFDGTLTDSDISVPMTLSDDRRRADAYVVTLRAGQTISVEMTSGGFDTYLRIERNGVRVANNDDAGSLQRSYVVYTAPQQGTYTVYASTFSETGRGAYSMNYRIE